MLQKNAVAKAERDAKESVNQAENKTKNDRLSRLKDAFGETD